MAETAWVLGAGFSKPLGGPLLWDLFTEESRQYVKDTLRNHAPTAVSVLDDAVGREIHATYQECGPEVKKHRGAMEAR